MSLSLLGKNSNIIVTNATVTGTVTADFVNVGTQIVAPSGNFASVVTTDLYYENLHPPISGGGTVDSVVAGNGITVDSTDPANPIVTLGAAPIGCTAVIGTTTQDVSLGFGIYWSNAIFNILCWGSPPSGDGGRQFIAPASGIYQCTAQITTTGTSTATWAYVINGNIVTTSNSTSDGTNSTTRLSAALSVSAGQPIIISNYGSGLQTILRVVAAVPATWWSITFVR